MGALKELLATGRTIILDSAMGTELQQRGANVKLPLWSAAALFEKPDTVRHIHIDNIDTGADIITTNTFRTQRRTYEKANYKYVVQVLDACRAADLWNIAFATSPADKAATENPIP